LTGKVHVVESAAYKDCSDAAEEAEERAEDEDGGNVLSQSKANEAEREAEIGPGVDDAATDEFAEGSQDEGCDGADDIEEEEAELAYEIGDAELVGHFGDSRGVGGCGEADEECHKVEHGGHASLVPWIPIERIGAVTVGKGEYDVLIVVALDNFREGERHIDVDFGEWAMVGVEAGFLVRFDVAASNDSS
jgi:hypothetical protein